MSFLKKKQNKKTKENLAGKAKKKKKSYLICLHAVPSYILPRKAQCGMTRARAKAKAKAEAARVKWGGAKGEPRGGASWLRSQPGAG